MEYKATITWYYLENRGNGPVIASDFCPGDYEDVFVTMHDGTVEKAIYHPDPKHYGHGRQGEFGSFVIGHNCVWVMAWATIWPAPALEYAHD